MAAPIILSPRISVVTVSITIIKLMGNVSSSLLIQSAKLPTKLMPLSVYNAIKTST